MSVDVLKITGFLPRETISQEDKRALAQYILQSLKEVDKQEIPRLTKEEIRQGYEGRFGDVAEQILKIREFLLILDDPENSYFTEKNPFALLGFQEKLTRIPLEDEDKVVEFLTDLEYEQVLDREELESLGIIAGSNYAAYKREGDYKDYPPLLVLKKGTKWITVYTMENKFLRFRRRFHAMIDEQARVFEDLWYQSNEMGVFLGVTTSPGATLRRLSDDNICMSYEEAEHMIKIIRKIGDYQGGIPHPNLPEGLDETYTFKTEKIEGTEYYRVVIVSLPASS